MLVNFVSEIQDVFVEFSVQWDGGESDRTSLASFNVEVSIDMDSMINPPPLGTSCWARAYLKFGPNHDSSQNFTFEHGGGVLYTLTGTLDTPSFSMT